MMGSWSTARDGGFSDSDIAALLRIQNNLALAARMAVLSRLAGNMLTTYLGGGAGTRVLSGQIKRGDGETIRAALVMADMRRSTELAERSGRQEFIDILNEFFDAMAGPFAEAGGEILSFVGDGFLAVFPCPRQKTPTEIACRSALASARVAVARMAAFNAPRRQEGLDEIGYGIGLHIGNVMFGNVGLRDRLTFSVFGPAVNDGAAPPDDDQEVFDTDRRQQRLRRLLRRRLDEARQREAARSGRGDDGHDAVAARRRR